MAVTVQAAVRFSEGSLIHAEPGDVGDAHSINGPFVIVTWRRTGTTCDCDPEDLTLPRSRRASRERRA